MKNTHSFQTILLLVFGIGAVIGVAVFSIARTTNPERNLPTLQMWGTLPEEYFSFLGQNNADDVYFQKVAYREIRSEEFDQILIEALADGVGPDLVVLGHDSVYKHRNRIFEIPFESFSASTFSASYIKGGEIFQSDRGYYALPAVIDPLVMYWNRPILSSLGIDTPPASWDTMRDFSERVTKTDGFLNIERSAVALGTSSNINHVKEVISLLLMQSGSRIVAKGATGYVADFSQQTTTLSLPPSEAINFYTEFSDPSKLAYSWNTSLPESRAAFLAEDLALYFGLASEEREILSANPNLSFGVALVPQVSSSPIKMTTGDLYGFAVLKSTSRTEQAFTTLYKLAGVEGLTLLDERTGLPSVHNTLRKEDPTKASSRVLLDSALITRVWLDPEPRETDRVFSDMIESVRSNQSDAGDALSRLASQLNQLFRN
ncbi:MAG: ABC transporter substrate-binding protein [Candidatus Paceibacterota bacterium]